MEEFESLTPNMLRWFFNFALRFNGHRHLFQSNTAYQESHVPTGLLSLGTHGYPWIPILSLLTISNYYGELFSEKIAKCFNSVVQVTEEHVEIYVLKFCEKLTAPLIQNAIQTITASEDRESFPSLLKNPIERNLYSYQRNTQDVDLRKQTNFNERRLKRNSINDDPDESVIKKMPKKIENLPGKKNAKPENSVSSQKTNRGSDLELITYRKGRGGPLLKEGSVWELPERDSEPTGSFSEWFSNDSDLEFIFMEKKPKLKVSDNVPPQVPTDRDSKQSLTKRNAERPSIRNDLERSLIDTDIEWATNDAVDVSTDANFVCTFGDITDCILTECGIKATPTERDSNQTSTDKHLRPTIDDGFSEEVLTPSAESNQCRALNDNISGAAESNVTSCCSEQVPSEGRPEKASVDRAWTLTETTDDYSVWTFEGGLEQTSRDSDVRQTSGASRPEEILNKSHPKHTSIECHPQHTSSDGHRVLTSDRSHPEESSTEYHPMQSSSSLQEEQDEDKMNKLAVIIAFGGVLCIYLNRRGLTSLVDTVAATLQRYINVEYKYFILDRGGWSSFFKHCRNTFNDLRSFGELLE